jgi:hypothetical protein
VNRKVRSAAAKRSTPHLDVTREPQEVVSADVSKPIGQIERAESDERAFFIALRYINFRFWMAYQIPGRRKDILLTISTLALIYFARNTHAQFSVLLDSVKAFAVVIFAAVAISHISCLFDPRTLAPATYRENAVSCYRVLSILVVISAAIIATNHIYPWAGRLYAMLDLADSEVSVQTRALAFLCGTASFVVGFCLSCLQPSFRAGFRGGGGELIRTCSWCVFFFIATIALDCLMFWFPS